MIGEGQHIAKAKSKNVFLNKERKSGIRRRLDTVLVLAVNYACTVFSKIWVSFMSLDQEIWNV